MPKSPRSASPTIATLNDAGNQVRRPRLPRPTSYSNAHASNTPNVTSLAPQVPSVPWSEQARAYLATRKVSSEELSEYFDLALDSTLNTQSGYTDDEKLNV